jgi:hypothetical protein
VSVDRAPDGPIDRSLRGQADAWLYGLTLLLAFSLPFEPIHPLVSLGWLDVNHLKLLLLATLVLWIAGRSDWRELRHGAWPALLFVGLAVVSAITAPGNRADALKFVIRLGSGLYGLLLVRHVVTSSQRLTGLLWAVVLGAGASAVLGLGEAAGLQLLQPVLGLFKLAPTHVGGDLRVSASFQYATIASMFFELAIPLALILAATTARLWARGLATFLAALCSAIVVLTITRAGVVALAAVLIGIVVLTRARPRWRSLALPTALAGSSMAIAMLGLAVHTSALDTRFATENDWSWYAATYSVPPTLALTADVPTNATVVARNTGEVAWTSAGEHPFALAYRWLSADATNELELPATMIDLPRDVSPGDSVELTVPITARLSAGGYRLTWGMLQRNVLWFHDRGSSDAETAVQVDAGPSGGTFAPIAQAPRTDTFAAEPPESRTALWSAALKMIAQHPLLGVGPDNFRHMYGSYLGLSSWDPRVHANNLYLELLADMGVLGAAAFGLVIGSSSGALMRSFRTPVPAIQAVRMAGLSGSLAVFLLHGTLDYFLSFTPVYLLFWFVVGLSRTAPGLKP